MSAPGDRAAGAFRSVHGCPPDGVWSAPGRVNLIGEHTDYNDGFVLPFALTHRIAAAARARDDGEFTVASLGSDGRIQHGGSFPVHELRPGHPGGWQAYPAGVAWVLREEGVAGIEHGADVVLAGDVPTGAGLSSSAALECATAMALLGLGGAGDPDTAKRLRIARWAQRAENEFAGVPTGVLDQTASMCCTEGHALFLDVRSGATRQVPFDAAGAGMRVLVIDTRVQHALGESGYGDRRRGTERAADLLGVKALRDVSADTSPEVLAGLPAELRPLVRHVVSENQRVLDSVELLNAGGNADLRMLGPLLTASHQSLRDDYRVSSTELDLAVDAATAAGAYGARMTGGGFGGSAIALVGESDEHAVRAHVTASFERAGLAAPRIFTALPSAGAASE